MSAPPPISALILAGSSAPEKDRLAEYTRGGSKALIPIAGKPMIAYVIQALSGSSYVRHIVVVGLEEPLSIESPVSIDYIPAPGGMTDNFLVGVQYLLDRWPETVAIVGSSSDIPLITTPMVDAFVASSLETDYDLYFNVVERSVMETRFPASERSYVRLREGSFAGGDLSMMRPSALKADLELVRALSGERKNARHQARLIGWRTLALLLLGRLSIPRAEARVSQVLGIRGRLVICPHPEIGMDVDKPFQLDIVRAELEAGSA